MYKIRLSPYAEIFYNEWLLAPESCRYNLVIDQILYGNLNINRLERSLKRYITDHIVLNSHIQEFHGEAHWVVNNEINQLQYINHSISDCTILNFVTKAFDLHNEPLYRFLLIRISQDKYRFILVFHHILMGGSTMNKGVFERISNYYNNEDYNIDYSLEQQENLLSTLAEKLNTKLSESEAVHRQFWSNQLDQAESVDLNFLKLKTSKSYLTNDYSIKEIRFNYGKDELLAINRLKRKYIINPYCFSRCIFVMLLHNYTQQKQIVINYPIAIKDAINFIYGVQVNTNLIPYQLSHATTVTQLFSQNLDFYKALKQGNMNHIYYPISNIIEEENNKSLLDLIFMETNLKDKKFDFTGIEKVEVKHDYNVDLLNPVEFEFEQEDKTLKFRVRYDKSIIDKKLITQFVQNYKRLFREVLDDLEIGISDKPIGQYFLLNKAEYERIIYSYNKINKPFPYHKTMHQLFEEQVAKTPNTPALIYENTKLTYSELNSRANQLARYLIAHLDIKPDDIIALMLDRNENVIITMLAVLKSGAAYIPIDPQYPDERIDYIIKDTRAKAILTVKNYSSRLNLITAKIKTSVINIDLISTKNLLTTNINTITASQNLAYIIYTSGTTGNPKGVMIEHKSVVNLIHYLGIDIYKLKVEDKVSAFCSYIFDVSIAEFFTPLTAGAALYLLSDKLRTNIESLSSYIRNNKINHIYLPPALLAIMPQTNYPDLYSITYAGEPCSETVGKYWSNYLKLFNYYGPTETTIYALGKQVIDGDTHLIGKPVNNYKAYVLDNSLKALPIGAIGELYIGGIGLARGYLNQPELTAQKFIDNLFQNEIDKQIGENTRLYKTGDLVRMLPDGNIEFIGRNDSQIKIRGYRIEIDEIQSILNSYPQIISSVVVVKDVANNPENKYLVAYYLSEHKLSEDDIYNHLATKLPNFMIPNHLIHLDKFPITVNGKLDTKALPIPDFVNADNYVPPSNYQEELICAAYTKVLEVDSVGVNDDFIKLGGNSLKVIQLVSLLQTNFDVKVADIFAMRTPRQLADNLKFGQNFIEEKLHQVKSSYQYRSLIKQEISELQDEKINKYLATIRNWNINCSITKPIKNILLTGGTGFLGCNLLNQVLNLTNYNIYLLVRANNHEEAFKRVNAKYQYYFDKSLDRYHNTRLFTLNADIEQGFLGLPEEEYKFLTQNIDSIIHAAALVKHYGEYEAFYAANVQATINLLEFTRLTKLKDFHYISTYGVPMFADDPNLYQQTIYTEDDVPQGLNCHNVYIKTKLLGEQEVIKYRELGINADIYRVGNLAYIAENFRIQENIEDNAFAWRLKCLLKLGCIAPEIGKVEISPVDLTAIAIIKLFDKAQLKNNIYHVYNPQIFDIAGTLTKYGPSPIKKLLSMSQLIDRICISLRNQEDYDLITRFLLHQGWLEGRDITDNTSSIIILQDRTEFILKHLGFEWAQITNRTFYNYIKHFISKNNIIQNLVPANSYYPTNLLCA